MAAPSLEVQFHGTVALAVLHLRRLAKSNDLEKCFAAARELRMLDDAKETFMRECFDLDERRQAGDAAAEAVTQERLDRLRRCILSINSADPA